MSKVALPQDGRAINYHAYFNKCKDERRQQCALCKNGGGHGPYWSATWKDDDGFTVRSYLGASRDGSKLSKKQRKIVTRVARKPEPAIYATFDASRFFTDLDRIRQLRGCTWNHIARMAGITGTTAIRQRSNLRINTLIPLALWAGLSLDNYIKREQEGEI